MAAAALRKDRRLIFIVAHSVRAAVDTLAACRAGPFVSEVLRQVSSWLIRAGNG